MSNTTVCHQVESRLPGVHTSAGETFKPTTSASCGKLLKHRTACSEPTYLGVAAQHVVVGATTVLLEVLERREGCFDQTAGQDHLMNARHSTVRGHLP